MTNLNPECQQGKHDNCDTVAYDPEIDDLCLCECRCHGIIKQYYSISDEVRDTEIVEHLRELRIIGLAYPVIEPKFTITGTGV